ncbi:hypothetical protein [Mycolicibacterium phocaicum]|nr:hypothetical protein [Mycolicibacterium phocaicum]BBZ57059.1 hypothetical protein MPHO_40510 [Mycolicibacterium phocaicum]
MHPNIDQADRDALDDLGLIDTGMAGDDEAAPVYPGVSAPAGTASAH